MGVDLELGVLNAKYIHKFRAVIVADIWVVLGHPNVVMWCGFPDNNTTVLGCRNILHCEWTNKNM